MPKLTWAVQRVSRRRLTATIRRRPMRHMKELCLLLHKRGHLPAFWCCTVKLKQQQQQRRQQPSPLLLYLHLINKFIINDDCRRRPNIRDSGNSARADQCKRYVSTNESWSWMNHTYIHTYIAHSAFEFETHARFAGGRGQLQLNDQL